VAAELGCRTVAIHSRRSFLVCIGRRPTRATWSGDGKGPVEAYLDIAEHHRIATEAASMPFIRATGFLSESSRIRGSCAAANIIFVGPLPDTCAPRNKVRAPNLAAAAGVPVMPATPPLPPMMRQVLAMAHAVGFPGHAEGKLGRWRPWHARHRG